MASIFSDETAGLVKKVVVAGGKARVVFRDFRRIIPKAGTSSGGIAFQFSLNLTVFQFADVKQVSYSIEGSCASYWEFLQVEVCRPVTRESMGKSLELTRLEEGPRRAPLLFVISDVALSRRRSCRCTRP